MRMDNVDFVVDLKTTPDAFNSVRTNITEFGQTQSLFSSHFVNSRVEFNRRQTNVVAHALASETILSASPNIYLEVPRCITTLNINEMI